MNNYFEDVDRMARESLQEWETPPPAYIAEKVHRRMFWTNFWRRRTARYALIGMFALISLSTAGLGIFLSREHTSSEGQLLSLTYPAKAHDASDLTSYNSITTPTAITNNTPESSNKHNNNNCNYNSTASKIPATNIGTSDPQTPVQTGSREPVNSYEQEPLVGTSAKSPGSDAVEPVAVSSSQSNMTATNDGNSNIDPNANLTSVRNSRLPNIQTSPFLAFTNPEHTKTLSVIAPSKKSHYKPLFDIQLDLSAQFANLGEKHSGLVKSQASMTTGAASLLVHYYFKNCFLESGLQYTRLQTQTKGDNLMYNPHEALSHLFVGQELLIDTNGYWHYKWIQDSVIHIYDSVWVTEYDSSFNDMYEDQIYTAYDTLASPKWKTNISLFEIPLGIGYRFFAFKTEFSIKAGVLFGISSKVGGYTYLGQSSAGLVPMTEIYSSKGIQYSYYISAGIARNITEDWSLILSPSWRSSINGLKGIEGYENRKYNSWGLGIGVRYEF